MIRLYLHYKNYGVLQRADWIHFMQTYKKLVKKNYRVLEIGGSVKERTEELAKYCKELVMVEKFQEKIPEFDSGNNIKTLQGDWQDLSLIIEPKTIDIICASHVIEHVKDDLRALNESYKVLKRGGFLLFNTPNRKRLIRAIIEFFKGPKDFRFREHQREYIESDLKELIKKSKFSSCPYKIKGISFGIGGPVLIYSEKVPKMLRRYATYWEVVIKKRE